MTAKANDRSPMARKPVRGLFVTGTDTAVGKTYVTALVARGRHRVFLRVLSPPVRVLFNCP